MTASLDQQCIGERSRLATAEMQSGRCFSRKCQRDGLRRGSGSHTRVFIGTKAGPECAWILAFQSIKPTMNARTHEAAGCVSVLSAQREALVTSRYAT